MGTTISAGVTSTLSTSEAFGTVSGTLIVSGGGVVALGWTIEPGGSITVESGGVLSSTEQYGGTITVAAGGTASGTTEYSTNGSEIVLAGGSDFGAFVTLLEISAGAVAVDGRGNVIVSGGGTEEITAGSSAGGGTVLDGGVVSVGTGGTATGFLLSSGATLSLATGASGSQITLDAGAIVSAASGATLVSLVVNSGETFTLAPGIGDLGATVVSGGVELVGAGAVASGTGIEGGGSIGIEAGGTAAAPYFLSGTMTVSSGGTVIDPSFTGGTLTIQSGGTLEVTSSGSTYGATLLSGAVLAAVSGAAIDQTTLGGGVTLTVSAGLTDSGSLVQSGASEIVTAGGVATKDTITLGATLTVSAGGTADNTQLGTVVYSYVSSTNSNVSSILSGGTEVVSSGGIASGGNSLANVQGLIEFGGTQTVLAGGTATNFVVSSGGMQIISSGGLAIDTRNFGGSAVISSGGTLELLSGQQVENVSLLSGAVLITPPSGGGALTGVGVGSGVTLSVSSTISEFDTFISAGGDETVGAGHAASGVTVYAHGILNVTSGGLVSGTDLGSSTLTVDSSGNLISSVQPGGDLFVSSGGTADTTAIFQGGQEFLLSGALGSGASVGSGGQVTVFSTALLYDANVQSGGLLTVSNGGVVSGGQLGSLGATGLTQGSSGGSAVIAGGGLASGLAVYSGGVMDVASGGIVNDATLGAGTLDLAAGAVVEGAITMLSGVPGSDLIIGGTVMPTVPISGFAAGDTIDLAGIPFASGGSVVLGPSGTLSVTENGKTYALDLSSASLGGHALKLVADASGGTEVEVACFAAGTRIATPAGEVPVEALRPGDAVLALIDGAWRPAPVRWVGRTTVDLARHPHPEQAAPIRLHAGAIADGIPSRDLWLSPDHAVFLDGALFQAQALQNGATVLQDRPARITYFHVELDRHAILCAEGLPAESYLDTGNRALFGGEAGARALHPDLAAAVAWDVRACATLHLAGSALAAVHARLLLRAVALGHVLTADPALRLLADGRDVLAFAAAPDVWQATLPAGTRTLRLQSRHFVPSWFAEDDRRRLGIAVRSLHLAGRRLPPAAFGSGWHAPEPEWCWSDGDASLTLLPRHRPATLVLTHAHLAERYWTSSPACVVIQTTEQRRAV